MVKTLAPLVLILFLGTIAVSPALSAAGGGTVRTDQTDLPYDRAVQHVEDGNYEDALPILRELNRKDSGNPDVLNMLGFAHRKLGRLEEAFEYYQEALKREPRHLGANEYLGELFLELGELAQAEERLRELEAACPAGCEERSELSDAIVAYRKAHGL